MRAGLILAAAILAGPAHGQTEPEARPSRAPPPAVVDWVRRDEIAIAAPEAAPNPAQARTVDAIVAGATVIGFGEDGHGNHEPLAYRNQLVRYLVEHGGLTAVALESGLAESRQLYDYVLGGAGDAEALTRTGLTHGFGVLRENVQLVEYLRSWNAGHPGRPVHLYGIDLSTIQSAPPDAHGYGVVLEHLDAYLLRAAPTDSGPLRRRLAVFSGRFTENDYPSWSAADRAEAAAMLDETDALLRTRKAALARSTSAFDWVWAEREAHDARALLDAFGTWTNDPAQLQKLMKVIAVRDLAMADNLEWALGQEGPGGKVLLFQNDGHIAAAPLVGSVMRFFPSQPEVTGTLLRARMGAAYCAIGTISSRGRSADDSTLGDIDRAFAAAGEPAALLKLHATGRSSWWDETHSASQGDHRVDDMVPAKAFDAFLYIDRLTPVQPLEKPFGS